MHRTRADQPYVGIPTPGNDPQEIGVPGGKFLAQIDRYEWRPPRYWHNKTLFSFAPSDRMPAKYGPQNPDVLRAVFQTPLFDTRPWLRNDYAAAGQGASTEIDTGFFDDAFDVFASFLVYPPGRDVALVDLPGFADLSVYVARRGHPTDPAAVRMYEQRQDITLDLQQSANEAWLYEVPAMGALRYIGYTLIFDHPATTSVGALECAASFM